MVLVSLFVLCASFLSFAGPHLAGRVERVVDGTTIAVRVDTVFCAFVRLRSRKPPPSAVRRRGFLQSGLGKSPRFELPSFRGKAGLRGSGGEGSVGGWRGFRLRLPRWRRLAHG